jgi:hypothetical protein
MAGVGIWSGWFVQAWLGKRLLLPESTPNGCYSQVPLSSSGEHVEIAHRLFAALREADELKPDLIVAHEIDEKCQGEALAIMNRLSKAASQRI